MAPSPFTTEHGILAPRTLEGEPGSWRKHASIESFIVESWGQGVIVGALMIMACVTISNMRKGVLLHKIIFLELLLALSHGTFCFMSFKGYGWYLSGTACLLYISTLFHNVIAWMKIKPFLRPTASRMFIGSFCLTIPPVLFQSVNNFLYFNNISLLYTKVRPFEAVMRDPWWMFSCLVFFYVIKTRYTVSFRELIKQQPRFAIMMMAMFFSFAFAFTDALVSAVPALSQTNGVNPYWKLALVFKCLTDMIILDDFKTCLDKLRGKLVQGSHMDSMRDTQQGSQKEFTFKKERQPTITSQTAPNAAVVTAGRRAPRPVRHALGRIGQHISPLQAVYQHRPDLHPPGHSSSSADRNVIHVKTDFSLDKFINNFPRGRSASVPSVAMEPMWPRQNGTSTSPPNANNSGKPSTGGSQVDFGSVDSHETRVAPTYMPTVNETPPKSGGSQSSIDSRTNPPHQTSHHAF